MSKLTLSLIYARSEDRVIGVAGKIPWRLPDDFKHFKQTTMGKPILMGRKTYEDHESALPGRLNVVITRQPDYPVADGVEVAASLDDAIALASRSSHPPPVEVFVIGGVSFFAQALPHAQRVYETVVHADLIPSPPSPEERAVLPELDFTGWDTKIMQQHPADDRHAFAFTVYRHERDA